MNREPEPGFLVHVMSPTRGGMLVKLEGHDAVSAFVLGASAQHLLTRFRARIAALADDWRFMTPAERIAFEAL